MHLRRFALFLLAACVKRGTVATASNTDPLRHPWLTPRETAPFPKTHVLAIDQVNFGQNVRWSPRYAFRPGADIESLVEIMKWVDRTLPPTMKVKAGGSRHSFSAAASTGGVYLHPEGMKFIRPLTDSLYEVGAGTTFHELNVDLWARGKALPVLGGYDGQTLGGGLPTGTHGSMLTEGVLADALVRQVNLVTATGQKVRIEPLDGALTDATSFLSDHPDWQLLQDNRAFAAAKVNLGTFGVVHSYVIRAVDRFWLEEVRTRTTIGDARDVLREQGIWSLMQHHGASTPPSRTFGQQHPTPAEHLELLWNVHSGNVVVTTRHRVDETTRAELQAHEPPSFADPPGRNLFRVLATDRRDERPAGSTWLTNTFGPLVSSTNELSQRLAPAAIPALLDAAMNTLPDEHYVNRSYNVFNVGNGTNAMPFLFGTISVPLAGDQYLTAIDVIERVAAQFAARGRYQDGPVAIRFTAGLLPPQGSLLSNAEATCHFEFIFSGNDLRSRTDAEQFIEAYDTALREKLGSRVKLHLGHVYPSASPQRTAASYPGFAAFNQLRKQLDPHGRFTNEFQERLFGP